MTLDELNRIAAQGECETVEFKESLQAEALQTVGAFANTRGGMLLIGVNDSGLPVGITVNETTLRSIADRISSCTEPKVMPEVSTQILDGRTVVVVQVSEFPIKPVSVRGRCYRRVGSSNRQMSPHAIAEMHLASTGTSWDASQARGKAFVDIDLDRVRQYMTLATNVGRRSFATGSDPREVLEKLELVQREGATWAAVLLFGKRPQSPLVQATVHCGRFATETEILDDRLIEGSIVDQIDETMDFLKKHTNVRFVITGESRREQVWDYPLAALREAVANAICHRDYSDGADIQIKVFDDHIRIWNPGFLPPGVTIDDLYRRTHASRPRNKLIAQVFYDLQIIERYGSGIQRMLDACEAAGMPEPVFEESTGGFLITFRKASESVTRGEPTPQVTMQDKSLEDKGETASAMQVTMQVTMQVAKMLELCSTPRSREELQTALRLRNRDYFRRAFLLPAMADGLVEHTIPDKPTSRSQRYRLTDKGRVWLAAQNQGTDT